MLKTIYLIETIVQRKNVRGCGVLKPQEEMVPTKKGFCLRPQEYIAVKDRIPEIGRALPELDRVIPCNVQSDHMNQFGALQCSECNPNDYENL